VLHGLQGCCGFITDDMLASSIAMGGGGARATFGSCGAFVGGLMALSAKMAPRTENPTKEQIAELEKSKEKFYEFRDWFISEFGGVSCDETLHKLFGGRWIEADEQSRAALKKRQAELGFNCQVVTAKTAIKIAEMIL
jgi:hypothetical protein